MKTDEAQRSTFIKPGQLVGTKWKGWSELFSSRMSMEFVDKTNCIYTSQPKKYPMTYTVTDGKLFISEIEGTFELVGNVFFCNSLPVFEKAA
jgi:hypothetical protein